MSLDTGCKNPEEEVRMIMVRPWLRNTLLSL
jgi:hypothetical protein